MKVQSFSSSLEYKIAAIPTTYDGIRYRSRLEARWAAMFDMLGWRHHYEPMDLNGWIPDFLLEGSTNVLVEVKPITEMNWDTAIEIGEALPCDCMEFEPLLLGCVVPVFDHNKEFGIGWLREYGTWSLAVPCYGEGHSIGFCHSELNYHNRISGEHTGGYGVSTTDEREIIAKWKEAGNIVQWHKR